MSSAWLLSAPRALNVAPPYPTLRPQLPHTYPAQGHHITTAHGHLQHQSTHTCDRAADLIKRNSLFFVKVKVALM